MLFAVWSDWNIWFYIIMLEEKWDEDINNNTISYVEDFFLSHYNTHYLERVQLLCPVSQQ